jgi:hypothetical protein
VCDAGALRHVSYVYGNDLRQANGRAVTNASELERLDASHDEFARYVVEVCLECRWNHLVRRELHGRRHDAVPGRARRSRSESAAEPGMR